ncbi:MAG: glycosyltransferase [Deltaproteobacteria bacterium]|nr:glycosyltransferase [Deltaproteobacteria bacterium]
MLHIVSRLARGGAETWLMHVLRRTAGSGMQMDFATHRGRAGDYEAEARSLGSRVVCVGRPLWAASYVRNLARALRAWGPCDVVHCHVPYVGGLALWVAHQRGVPVRVCHVHSDLADREAAAGRAWRVAFRMAKRMIGRYATSMLFVSERAARGFFGSRWAEDPRRRVLPCGIDLSSFRRTGYDAGIRAELGLAPDSFVLGHVGRFTEDKNHPFLLDILGEVVREVPSARLLLVGEGAGQPAVQALVARKGLSGAVLFAGTRDDVPRLLLGAVDAFVLPSKREGVPLAGMEAQAAGLPLFLPFGIAEELDVIPSLITRLPTGATPATWAEAICLSRGADRISQGEALAVLERSTFNIDRSVESLLEVYREGLRARRGADV